VKKRHCSLLEEQKNGSGVEKKNKDELESVPGKGRKKAWKHKKDLLGKQRKAGGKKKCLTRAEAAYWGGTLPLGFSAKGWGKKKGPKFGQGPKGKDSKRTKKTSKGSRLGEGP